MDGDDETTSAREPDEAPSHRGGAPQQSDRETGGFPIVAIGASAGGLQALSELLAALPKEPGISIVIVSHMDPEQRSQMAELLSRKTDLPVDAIETGVAPAVDHVYVCPPGHLVEMDEGQLVLRERDPSAGHDYLIDGFLRTLAAEHGPRAAGVVLSGSLSDGARGLKDIQAGGGVTFAQEPSTASHPSMPASAIETGHVDFVLSPAEIADELARVGRTRQRALVAPEEPNFEAEKLWEVFEQVYKQTGVDFADYKRSTLMRRVQRRMMARRVESIDAYLELLPDDPEEARKLHDESLIHVTGFFRDPDVYEALKTEVFPDLLEAWDDDGPIRVWVPGCATGEEPYSVAIALHEFLDERDIAPRLQVFGTDLSEHAIQKAREAIYPASIEEDVPDERLARYFTEEGAGYRLKETIRNLCIFARQDLVNDPPFSDIDLVSCRNVLIYLNPDRQGDVAATLHYALKSRGFLLLGSSESADRFQRLFDAVDREHKIYRRKDAAPRRMLHQVGSQPSPTVRNLPRPSPQEVSPEGTIHRAVDQAVVEEYSPPGLVVDADLDVVEFRGNVGRYLSPDEGEASLNVMRIAPKPLAMAIRSAVEEVETTGRPVRREGIGLRVDETQHTIHVRVIPVQAPGGADVHAYLVAFEEAGAVAVDAVGDGIVSTLSGWVRSVLSGGSSQSTQERVEQLEQELEATRRYLQSLIEEYEATTEELRSANEEALSTNEELQSTNEELETAKEELQSTNEELTTVNEELRERNEEIQQVNDDLVNLLNSAGLPIVMLDRDLKIRRFTPPAEDLLGLLGSDVGRPLDDLNLPGDETAIKAAIQDAIDTGELNTLESQAGDGQGVALRIRPYRTQGGEIDGAVLVLRRVGTDS